MQSFSTLQRVEIAEILNAEIRSRRIERFSTLQRVEIAEILRCRIMSIDRNDLSVLFNESKLLKLDLPVRRACHHRAFQYSSTSRNC